MPATRVRKTSKMPKAAHIAEKKTKRTGKAVVPKNDRYWYYIPLEAGGYQRICRPKGKTSVPLAVIRKAVREVVAERLAKTSGEGQND